ncbi:MAG: spermidine synthase [Sulfuricurvum sp.]
MRKFIQNEMLIHTALCTNKDPKRVLIISKDASKLEKEVQKHKGVACTSIDPSLEALSSVDAGFDVIISDLGISEAMLAHTNRVLNSDALLVLNNLNLDDVSSNKEMLSLLAKSFKIIMPFYIGGEKTALLASKEYHPTADIILHRADLLDGLEYYNSDLHRAAFAVGNYIRKEYLGYFKN